VDYATIISLRKHCAVFRDGGARGNWLACVRVPEYKFTPGSEETRFSAKILTHSGEHKLLALSGKYAR